MIKEVLFPFITVGLAELGDKTQFAILSLSSTSKKRLMVFLAAMCAFILVDGLAVVFGSIASSFIPINIIKVAAGIVFIGYGVYTLIQGSDDEKAKAAKHSFIGIVLMIILLEMGDKSQISTLIFAAQYNPFLVFIGVELALGLLTLAAVALGYQLSRFVKPGQLKIISGIIFIAVGIFSLL